MNFEKRLEDARARRQIVLEQKDRAARAAKAAAKRTPEPAKPLVPNSDDAQEIPRARPAGTNARALEAALRKRVTVPPPISDATVEPHPRPSEDNTSEISDTREDQPDSTLPTAANADFTYAEPRGERKPLAGKRTLFVGIAILAGFGLGIFVGPLIVARIQGLVSPPLTSIAQDEAPLQPSAAEISKLDFASLSSRVGSTNGSTIGRAVPGSPTLIAFRPELPFVYPAPAQISERVASVSSRISAARPLPRATQSGSTESRADTVDSAVSAVLLSPGPRIEAIPGTRVLALPSDPDVLPSLPLRSSTPNVPSASPKALSPVTGDSGASVDTAQPPATEKPSPRLTGIGSLGTYLVHVQSPTSFSDERLAEIQSVIAETGLPAGKLNRVRYKISSSHVRFYHRRDAVAAAALSERIGARSRDFTNFRPSPPIGTLEVFLSGSANTRRAATQTRTQPGEQDREFIELRDRLVESLRNGDHL